MSLSEISWDFLNQLSGDELKIQLFSILQQAAWVLQTEDLDEPQLLSLVPRLTEIIESRPELSTFRVATSALARSVGLWNYIDKDEADARDHIVAEAATIPDLGIVLHREQLSALNTLLSGQNLILSAPTSFGKSILIDVLLLQKRYRRVAIVLPTIALLDEFRRRLTLRFGDEFDILMHPSEQQERDRVIFLGTQERLINRNDLGYLDLVVVDEFYKLDPNRRDERSITLNAAVYKLLSRASQFFFLGPNIENVRVSNDSRWKFTFLRTRFSTVAVDTFDLKDVDDKEARLYEEIYRPENWPALVFVSSPDKANRLASNLVNKGLIVGHGKALSDWMLNNYGGRSDLSDAVAAGIGIHHGRIPRALASHFVRLFNDKILPVLICTSTLIEGVNTAAKSVLIYDKTINNRDYDFFTFSNIKGRAGRLGQHHIGQVFLFHNPPDREDVNVSAPLFGDLEDAPDEFIVHIDKADYTPEINDRLDEMIEKVGLTPEELKRASSLGIDLLLNIRTEIETALAKGTNLAWTGHPTYEELLATCSVICNVRSARDFGCASDRQLAMYIHKLRQSRTMREFYTWHAAGYRGDPERRDNVFKFLRAAEYGLPELFAIVELFLQKLKKHANYSLFLSELPRWFRAEALKILEEQGVPIQISERFLVSGDTVTTLGRRLREIASSADASLTPLERHWIVEALPG